MVLFKWLQKRVSDLLFFSGGILVTVKGTNLNSVEEPVMVVVVIRNNDTAVYYQVQGLCILHIGGFRGAHAGCAPLRDPILSFWHTNFTKRSHLGSPCPPYEVHAPLPEILDPPLLQVVKGFHIVRVSHWLQTKERDWAISLYIRPLARALVPFSAKM